MIELEWQKAIVKLTDSIETVIDVLNNSSLRITLVVDENNKLLGTITDGDIRRAFLKHVPLAAQAKQIMKEKPVVARSSFSRNVILSLMEDNAFTAIPIVTEEGVLCGLETLQNLVSEKHIRTPVFLMAGGFGRRLAPLTDNCPKPMLHVAGVPLLERIICQFSDMGFRNFYISVHYLSEHLVNYFGNGSKWNVSVNYIAETQPLGTAGALGLLPEGVVENEIIVMNGDVLTSVDFRLLLDFHRSSRSVATMALRKYKQSIPFGVVSIENDSLVSIDEKPVKECFVNAGIYVISKFVLSYVSKNHAIDMPELLMRLVSDRHEVKTFPIHERWLDIGRNSDYTLAQEYFKVMA